MNKIIIDIDHTFAPFLIYEAVKELYGVEAAIEDSTDWEWYKKFGLTEKEFYRAVDLAHENLWKTSPYPYAVEAVNEWAKKIPIIFATHREPHNICYIAEWLGSFGVNYHGVYCAMGGKECLFNAGDIVIDDKPDTLQTAWNGGCLPASLEWPWNSQTKEMLDIYIPLCKDWVELKEKVDEWI